MIAPGKGTRETSATMTDEAATKLPAPITYNCDVPCATGIVALPIETGRSIVIIGANGSGKTRLGVHIENAIAMEAVHRIAAQKRLFLNDDVQLISLEKAEVALRFGHPNASGNRDAHRWAGRQAVHELSDFDALQQRLFAENNRSAVRHVQRRKTNEAAPLPTSSLDRLKEIWDNLLPHRTLEITEATIKVRPVAEGAGAYAGSEMSDGERAIFYFLGQCLVQPQNGAIIIDEPEGHVHKAILGPLWDAIERARPDCSFIYITHDLDFAVSRTSASKYFVRSYTIADPHAKPPVSASWDIEALPESTGLPEIVVAEIVGSRKPVLFVEGERDSLDVLIYRLRYDKFTVMPIGGCDAVIHSVASFARNDALHWIKAKGLVDADDRTATAIAELQQGGVHVLPVAEIENVMLLPSVFTALAEALLFKDAPAKLATLTSQVMNSAQKELDEVSARYSTRQLDRRLKKVTVKAKDVASLKAGYQEELANIDVEALYTDFRTKLEKRIQGSDLKGVLELYDSKGLLVEAARLLGFKGQKELMAWVGRLLGSDAGKKMQEELSKVLPTIPV